MESIKEVEDFYLLEVTFIEECLQEGWKQKAKAEEKIRSEYE